MIMSCVWPALVRAEKFMLMGRNLKDGKQTQSDLTFSDYDRLVSTETVVPR